MKKLFFLIIFVMVFINLLSDTQIEGGNVSGVWTNEESPYIINGDITIPDLQTLEIKPGVIIKFKNFAKLDVKGKILAIGTEEQKIVFTKFDDKWGGINFENVSTENDSSFFRYCIIKNSYNRGMTIDNYSKVSVTYCEFTNNNGGMYLYRSCPVVDNNRFYLNTNDQTSGGGIRIFNTPAPLILKNNVFDNNTAMAMENYDIVGGGVLIAHDCDVTLINCLIINNSVYPDFAYGWGGGIYVGYNSNAKLINCTVANNHTYGKSKNYEDNNIKIWNNCYMLVFNSIVWQNDNSACITAKTNSTIDISYSNIGSEDILTQNSSQINLLEGNIFFEPKFIGDGNYHLSELSPAINNGSLDYPENINIPNYDIDGNPRIYDGTVKKIDMGCYEFQGEPLNKPEIEVEPSRLIWDFATVNPYYISKSFEVRNVGFTPLTISKIVSNSEYFKIKLNEQENFASQIEEFIIPPLSVTNVYVRFEPNELGEYNGLISIFSDDADEPQRNVELTATAAYEGETVFGVISKDTYWDADSIFVIDSLVIDENATLTIAPGTLIKVFNNARIDVKGDIIAKGTENNRIIFTKFDDKWGGINFENTTQRTTHSKFEYCDFNYSFKDPYVGVFYIKNSSNIEISHCGFYHNNAFKGGALFIDNSTMSISDCSFEQNRVFGEYRDLKGGAIYAMDASINLVNDKFIENYSSVGESGHAFGGACYFNHSDVKIISSIFYQNKSAAGGYYDGDYPIPFSSDAGAIYCDSGTIDIINTIFKDNYSNGVYEEYIQSSLRFINNATVNLVNSIVWSSLDYYGNIILPNNSTLNISYSDIIDFAINEEAHNYNNINWLEGNLSVDPSFIDEDCHLSPSSVLIDWGTLEIDGITLPTYDLDGNPRVFGNGIDIGCYEYPKNSVNEPEISISNTTLDWGTVSIHQQYEKKTIEIFNVGYGTLKILQITSPNPNFLIKLKNQTEYVQNLYNIELESLDTLHLDIIFSPKEVGSYRDEIFIYSNDTDEQKTKVTVKGYAINEYYIGGVIDEDLYLQADTVFVTRALKINEGVTLKIAPGTVLECYDNTYIDVKGSLIAEGTEDKRIVFTKYYTKWKGIVFDNTPEEANFSKFKYCDFIYARREDSDYSNNYEGAIYIKNYSYVEISNCNFYQNQTYSLGSAIHIEESTIDIVNCTFAQNRINNFYTHPFGGIVYGYNSDVRIINSKFMGNTLSTSSNTLSTGVACYFDNSKVSILSSFFDNNSAISDQQSASDVIHAGAIYTNRCPEFNIVNCTFMDNYSQLLSGEFSNNAFGFYNSSAKIINSIIWTSSNCSDEIIKLNNSTLDILHSDIIDFALGENSYLGDSKVNWLEGNLSVDPAFIDEDCHLKSSSPLIDAGTLKIEGVSLPALDLDGNMRVCCNKVDIGCYEYINENINQLLKRKLVNYPNPFNSATTILCNVSENTKSAKIEIYNLKGQKIKTIKLPNRSVGNIGVSWEGTDKQNHRLPSGMYILKLQENGKLKAISKCIFLK